jgi:ribosomal protein S18 acetylase RimI-like enzyme
MQSASVTPHNANPAQPVAPATRADVAALVTLINGAYRGESSRRGWTTEEHLLDGQRTDAEAVTQLLAEPGRVILVLRDAGALLGCVLLEMKADSVCYLGMLTVRPDLQARGLGRQLLEAAERHAQLELGARQVEMTVIDSRTELIAWYERRGYRATGEYRPFPYDDQRFGLPKRTDLRFVVLRRQLYLTKTHHEDSCP